MATLGLLNNCYSEADYQRRAIEELMRQQQYGQLQSASQYNSAVQSPPPERDNPVLLLLP